MGQWNVTYPSVRVHGAQVLELLPCGSLHVRGHVCLCVSVCMCVSLSVTWHTLRTDTDDVYVAGTVRVYVSWWTRGYLRV